MEKGMEEYNEQKILSKVKTAFNKGPLFDGYISQSQFDVVDGVEAAVKAKYASVEVVKTTPIDVWNQRRAK